MINKVSLNKQDVYKKDLKKSSYNTVAQNTPSFKGPIEVATSVLQYCNTNPMAGVSLIDMATAIVPRTVVDAKTNGFAAAETFRRESSGLVVNCLIPGFVVLGVAKLMEAFNKNSDFKGLSRMWANQDSLMEMFKHYIKSDKSADGFVDSLLSDAHVLNSKGAKLSNSEAWIRLKPEMLKDEITEYKRVIQENIKDKKVLEAARNGLYNKILKVTGGAEHIKLHGKVYHDNITTMLRDGIDVGQNSLK